MNESFQEASIGRDAPWLGRKREINKCKPPGRRESPAIILLQSARLLKHRGHNSFRFVRLKPATNAVDFRTEGDLIAVSYDAGLVEIFGACYEAGCSRESLQKELQATCDA
jgi:hypothetical protein